MALNSLFATPKVESTVISNLVEVVKLCFYSVHVYVNRKRLISTICTATPASMHMTSFNFYDSLVK
jgi:hypothetical protein